MKIQDDIFREVMKEVFPWVDEEVDDEIFNKTKLVTEKYFDKHQQRVKEIREKKGGSS